MNDIIKILKEHILRTIAICVILIASFALYFRTSLRTNKQIQLDSIKTFSLVYSQNKTFSKNLDKDIKTLNDTLTNITSQSLDLSEKRHLFAFFIDFGKDLNIKMQDPVVLSAKNLTKNVKIENLQDFTTVRDSIVSIDYELTFVGTFSGILESMNKLNEKGFVSFRSIKVEPSNTSYNMSSQNNKDSVKAIIKFSILGKSKLS